MSIDPTEILQAFREQLPEDPQKEVRANKQKLIAQQAKTLLEATEKETKRKLNLTKARNARGKKGDVEDDET